MFVKRVSPEGSIRNQLLKMYKSGPNTLASIYGEEATRSDYSFTRAMLQATPDQVGLRSAYRDSMAKTMLLLYKSVATPTDSGLFFVESGNLKGFQYGVPRRSKTVIVDLFGENQGLEIMFFPTKNGLALTQQDINRVIQTLQPVDAAQIASGK